MTFGWDKTVLGRSGLSVSRLGLASSFGIAARDVEEAVERGINYLYWGTARTKPFGEAIRNVCRRRREDAVVVVQSYTRAGFFMPRSVDSALSKLGIDYCDLLCLGFWNEIPPRRIVDAALALRDAGKARHIMVSCHKRTTFPEFMADPMYAAVMVRYNASHPGAETEVFPHLAPREQGPSARPGVISYTATRWGDLLNPELWPRDEPAPRGSDCYRFALSQGDVDLTITGPKNRVEMTEAFAALDRGPMTPDELAWMKRVGKHVRSQRPKDGPAFIPFLDKLVGAVEPSPAR